MSDMERAKALFMQGLAQFESRQLEVACASFAEALALAPGRPSLLQNLGATLFQLHRDEEAIPQLREAVAADAEHGDSWLYLGLALQRRSRWPEAAAALDRALPLLPDDYALRLACAACHSRCGNMPRALTLYDQAIRQQPETPTAWIDKGNLLRETGLLDAARKCFAEAVRLGDEDMGPYYLAAVSPVAGAVPPTPPRRYVETLFDDYAGEFQQHLVEALEYSAHTTLCQPLREARYGAVLDLGCGTGLCGELMRHSAESLDGVDLSSAMLEQARASGVYRTLAHEDVQTYLENTAEQYDLVLAADVFIYVGDLVAVFAGVRRVLARQGVFAFSVELSSGAELALLPSLRYAHSEAYVRRLAAEHGLQVKEVTQAPIRKDQQKPIQGLYVYLHAP
jgi:predicted TPR repeat methyltransferase